jgi:hypothetical protein
VKYHTLKRRQASGVRRQALGGMQLHLCRTGTFRQEAAGFIPTWVPGIIISILLSGTNPVFANYSFNSNCKAAYDAAWAFNANSAGNYINLEKAQNPGNLVPRYLENLTQFITIFANEDKAAFSKFKKEKEARLDAIEKDTRGPWYCYCREQIYIQSAILKLKFNDYSGAAYDFNKAYRQLTDCTDKYPDFLPARKDLLLLKSVVGTVPGNYRWALKILGFSGDLKSSMTKYEALLTEMSRSKEYNGFTRESRIIYAYLSLYLSNKPDQAWKQMNLATKDYSTNVLDAFVRGNLAMRLKMNETAIQAFSPHVKNAPSIIFLDYMMGVAKLEKGDKDAAFYLGRFIQQYKGEHYVKDAYLKLGWAFLLAGDEKHYKSAMELVPMFGNTQLEEDKNALNEARTSENTVPGILRARLYFDGGYLDKALNEIKKVNPGSLANDFQKAEYTYRYARIEDAMDKDDDALNHYQMVIDKYSGLSNYFAPASCLYAGLIWEKRNNVAKARSYFNKCIDYHGYVYKDSFDQKAYAGLRRVD